MRIQKLGLLTLVSIIGGIWGFCSIFVLLIIGFGYIDKSNAEAALLLNPFTFPSALTFIIYDPVIQFFVNNNISSPVIGILHFLVFFLGPILIGILAANILVKIFSFIKHEFRSFNKLLPCHSRESGNLYQ